MHALILTLHVMACFLLVIVVLLQRGKGSDLGAALGGGSSNTIFGGRGAGNFLTRITTGAAICFMLTSLSLSYLGGLTDDFLSEISEGIEEPLQGEEAAPSGLLEEVPSADSEDVSPSTLEEIPLPDAAGEGSGDGM